MATYSKSARTKQRIYETARNLFLENGFDTTSLIDIAQAANVSTGTLYRYFPTKGDFLMQTERYSIDRLHEFAKTIPLDLPLSERICLLAEQDIIGVTNDIKCDPHDERAQEAINTSAAVVDYALASLGEPYASIEHLQMENDFRLELQGIYRDLIESSQQAGTCRTDVDADMLAQVMMALYFQELNYIVLDQQHDFNVHFKAKVDLVLEGKIPPREEAE